MELDSDFVSYCLDADAQAPADAGSAQFTGAGSFSLGLTSPLAIKDEPLFGEMEPLMGQAPWTPHSSHAPLATPFGMPVPSMSGGGGSSSSLPHGAVHVFASASGAQAMFEGRFGELDSRDAAASHSPEPSVAGLTLSMAMPASSSQGGSSSPPSWPNAPSTSPSVSSDSEASAAPPPRKRKAVAKPGGAKPSAVAAKPAPRTSGRASATRGKRKRSTGSGSSDEGGAKGSRAMGAITPEELADLVAKGLPRHLARDNLTREEERELKRQRRLIRNRESAHASRRRRKDHLSTLEQELRDARAEADALRRRLAEVTNHASAMQAELDRLGATMSAAAGVAETAFPGLKLHASGAPFRVASVCLMVMLFSFGLFFNPSGGEVPLAAALPEPVPAAMGARAYVGRTLHTLSQQVAASAEAVALVDERSADGPARLHVRRPATAVTVAAKLRGETSRSAEPADAAAADAALREAVARLHALIGQVNETAPQSAQAPQSRPCANTSCRPADFVMHAHSLRAMAPEARAGGDARTGAGEDAMPMLAILLNSNERGGPSIRLNCRLVEAMVEDDSGVGGGLGGGAALSVAVAS